MWSDSNTSEKIRFPTGVIRILIEFGRFAEQNRKRTGEGKPETFDFLGFTHISGKNGKGYFTVRRTTIRKRMRKKLQEIKQQFRQRMHDPVPQTGQWLRSVVQGYFNYYAVPENLDSLGVFRDRVLRLWGKHSGVVAKRASPRGLAALHSPDNGFPNLVCSILIPQLASPPVIRDKSRMR